jgi:mRNA-degrading endonuclease RelE of RelBE toxin-antitoxin system
MKYEVLTISPFDKQLKRLAKKYPSLKSDFSDLINRLETDPMQGVSLGKNCYKIRLVITSKGRGKSGGARVITNVAVIDNVVYLLAIYDKSSKATLTDAELKELLTFVSD